MSFSLKIGGVEHADNYKAGTLEIDAALNARSEATFILDDLKGPLTFTSIAPGKEVIITVDSTRVFGGTVETAALQAPGSQSGELTQYLVECVDFNQLADKKIIFENFEAEGQTTGDIIELIRAEHLAPDGVAAGTYDASSKTSRLVANFETMTTIFDKLSDREGGVFHWNIDHFKMLDWRDRTQQVAPISLTDANFPVQNFEYRVSRTGYRNRQYVRAGLDITEPQTETFSGDGTNRNFLTRFPVAEVPTRIFAAGVEYTGFQIGIQGVDQQAAWYWNKNSNVISQDFRQPRIAANETVEITYRGFLKVMVRRSDAAGIADRIAEEGGSGIYDHLHVEPEIEDVEFAAERADGFLARFANLTDVVSYTIFQPGLEVGQLQTINRTDHQINDTFLITQVTKVDRGDASTLSTGMDGFAYQINATDKGRFESWIEFFRDIFRAGRRVPDRDDQVIDILEFFEDGFQVTDSFSVNQADTLLSYSLDPYTIFLIGSWKGLIGSEAEMREPDQAGLPSAPQTATIEPAVIGVSAQGTSYPLAFPGAEGYEVNMITGGRNSGGYTLYKVSNLNNSGAGSFRDAAEATGNRMIIFTTGGEITLTSDVVISSGNVTIAGQTAPGDGVTLRGYGLHIDDDNVIVRGLRIRVGSGAPTDTKALDVRDCDNVIVDHCSFSWSDTIHNVSITNCTNVTLSYCIISESLDNPSGSAAVLFSGTSASCSVHHCLLAHCADDNPKNNPNAEFEFVNNIVYNWNFYGARVKDDANVNANNFITGPDWKGPADPKPIFVDPDLETGGGFLYAPGNIGPGRPTDTGDDWLIVSGDADESQRTNSPAVTASGVQVHDVDDIYNVVLDNAGSISLGATDTVDSRVVQEVKDLNGEIPTTEADVGGYPTLDAGSAPTDTDGDGIPDAWETANGLNPAVASDADDIVDGYHNLEHWFNSLIPLPPVPGGPPTGPQTAIAEPATIGVISQGTGEPVLAFPGAKGYNVENITGGRGGTIMQVTNLNDSGSGSFRDAAESTGARIIIFRIAGWVDLLSDVEIQSDCTIFAQTAPGDGFGLRDYGIVCEGDNIIIRGLKVRVGKVNTTTDCIGMLGVGGNTGCNNVIVDHCSFSWASDENTSVWYNSNNITYSYNYITEALDNPNHSAGLLVGVTSTNVSIHHNLFAHCADRAPATVNTDSEAEFVNNLIYNRNWDPLRCKGKAHAIKNQWIEGPSQQPSNPNCVRVTEAAAGTIYVLGNIGKGRPTDTGSEWLITDQQGDETARSLTPVFTESNVPASAHDIGDVKDHVLDYAGSISFPTGGDGSDPDTIDTRVRGEVLAGTQSWTANPTGPDPRMLSDEADAGGYHSMTGSPSLDSDSDGIPDAYEDADPFLDKSDGADAATINPTTGYMYIEDWANSLIPIPPGP